MHPLRILRFTGILIFFLGISASLPLAVSFFYGDGSANALWISMLVTCGTGLLLYLAAGADRETHLSHRDGVAIVTFGWLAAGLVGALPFMLSGAIPNFTDAYFESISGFTTTGASILNNIEKVPQGILFWRSLIQWLGGMGIIVLSIAILPFLGVGGMQLYKAEIPSPVVDKLKPRISDTAKVLWKVYILLTVFQILFLLGGGMSLFDAVCTTFSTMPTGGFSPKNASIAHYRSVYIDTVIVVFMLLAGMNFSLHYRFIKGDWKSFHRDSECRGFLAVVAVVTLVITFELYATAYDSLGKAFRYAVFQVSSIITTTGFVTADFDQWPALSKILLVLCMFLGGMAGSTGGGIKTMRVILLAKQAYQEMFRISHPHAVTAVKLGGKPVPPEVMSGIWGFTFLFLGLFAASTLVVAAMGLDLVSAVSAVATCICNTGPGLGSVGPSLNYLAVPLPGKWILMFCMLAGRLEIYTVIVLLTPEFWRK
ncbi:MAG: TrkH family potassium uptake protein [Deltaproteobacteria bacterium]|nr:TrkH family potassium uptake protein [Deltaproteobacteria bacterium]